MPEDVPDGEYLIVLALAAGDQTELDDDEVEIVLADPEDPAATRLLVDRAAFDALEDRGWITTLYVPNTAVTEQGNYWLKRWLAKRKGRHGRLVVARRRSWWAAA